MASLQMHHFPDLLGRLVSTSLFYFKSSWEDVRAAAPMLTGEPCPLGPRPPAWPTPDYAPIPPPRRPGFLALHAEAEHRPQVDLEPLTAGQPRASPAPPRPTPNLSGPRGASLTCGHQGGLSDFPGFQGFFPCHW